MSSQEDRRDLRQQVHLTAAEVVAIDEWGLQHRMPSRSAAVRALMERGMSADIKPQESSGGGGAASHEAPDRPH
jgi:hypothetical protein